MAQTPAGRHTMAYDPYLLIQEVHKRPPLWERKILVGKETVERLWREVAQAVGCRDKDAKARWKHMKDHFRKELKKVVEQGPSYVPVWPCYKKLLFLTDVLLSSKRISYSSDDISSYNVAYVTDNVAYVADNDEVIYPEIKPCLSEEARNSPKRRRETVDSVESIQTEIEPNADDKHDRSEARVGFDVRSEPRTPRSDRCARPFYDDLGCYSSDEDYHFFMSLIPHMKRFDSLQKLQVRNKIQQIIIEEMTKDATNDPATTSTKM